MKELIGKVVVVDTDASWVYVGRLESIDNDSVLLTGVDAHDKNDIEISKEKYILDTRRHGVKDNRKKTYVLRNRVVSICDLEDVVKF